MEKYNYVITTKISTKQKETLDKLKSKNIKISNFIRLAIKEKIQREYSELIKKPKIMTSDKKIKKIIDDLGISTEIQAKAILEMRLQRLTGLERAKIMEEYAEIQKAIAFISYN